MILKKGGICTLDEKGMKQLTVIDEAELIRRKSNLHQISANTD